MSTMACTRMSVRSPMTLATSQEIRDRGSTFVGYVYRAGTVDEVRAVLRRCAGEGESFGEHRAGERHVYEGHQAGDGNEDGSKGKRKDKDAHGPYVIAAWRCMAVKPGRTGLGGPDDFAVQEGCDDGGERWAGGRVLTVMKREGVMDAVVVVCRWFGGTLLGSARFAHMETCASEVCRRFKKIEEMDEYVQTLTTLDDLLATLRAELATVREQAGLQDSSGATESSRAKKAPDYCAMQDTLDLTKAKRLIHARECAIKATKTLLEKCKTST